MNKRGEKIFSIWWLLIMAMIGVVVIGAVLIYYSADVNIKNVESDLLYKKVYGCLIQDGRLIENSLANDFDIYPECGLSRKVFEKVDGTEEINFYLRVGFFGDTGNSLRENISIGERSYVGDCEAIPNPDPNKHPICKFRKVGFLYYADGEVKEGNLDILAVSNNEGERYK